MRIDKDIADKIEALKATLAGTDFDSLDICVGDYSICENYNCGGCAPVEYSAVDRWELAVHEY